MKRSTQFSLLLAGAFAVLPLTGLLAQEPAAAPTPSVSAPTGPATSTAPATPGESKKERKKEAMAALTPDERQELKAAHKKAMSDPAVEATKGDKKAHHKALHDAMIKADPNVEAIMAKMRASNVNKKDL